MIKVLPKILQHQIAAGEVVERPYSVVKELVENSIDAKAKKVSISIEEGGLKKIQVTDDGEGILKEDILLAFEQHATSKISTEEDLSHIVSYGFRGEALSSISSVSKVTVTTRRQDDDSAHQTKSSTEGFEPVKESAGAHGTNIIVEDLFYNTPARLKYLKTASTEYSHIARYITEVALAHPEVRFELLHNGKKNIILPLADFPQRVSQLLGADFTTNSVPISVDHTRVKIIGYVSKPTITYNQKKYQYISVNGRPIRSDLVSKAARDAYHRILPPGSQPHFVLQLTLPETDVDVNVHPRKTEVKFAHPGEIFSIVKGAIAQSFERYHDKLHPGATPIQGKEPQETSFNPSSRASSPYATKGFSTHRGGGLFSRSQEQQLHRPFPQIEKNMLGGVSEHIISYEHSHEGPFTYLGQLHRAYLVIMTEQGLMLIDQHAAHERVLFEQLLAKSQAEISQALLQPRALQLTPEEHAIVQSEWETFTDLGFALQEIDETTIGLTSVPTIVSSKGIDPEDFFMKTLRNFEVSEEGCSGKELHTFREKLLAYTACRSAVKFGDELSKEEATQLVKDFQSTPRKHTCPHGRCSMVEYSLRDLKKQFNR